MKFIKRKNIDTYKPKSQRFSVEVDGRAIIDTNKSLTVPIGTNSSRPEGVPGMIRYNTQIKDLEVFSDYSNWGWERLRTGRPADITVSNLGSGEGDGTVDLIEIVDGGSGYDDENPPTITIRDPDVGNDVATAVVTVENGVITQVTITNTGSGYITIPTITIEDANTSAELKVILTGTLEYELPIIPVNSLGSVSPTNVQIYIENVFQLPGINYTVFVGEDQLAYVRFDAPVPYGKPIYAIYGFDR
jgi:hypothetical protein